MHTAQTVTSDLPKPFFNLPIHATGFAHACCMQPHNEGKDTFRPGFSSLALTSQPPLHFGAQHHGCAIAVGRIVARVANVKIRLGPCVCFFFNKLVLLMAGPTF